MNGAAEKYEAFDMDNSVEDSDGESVSHDEAVQEMTEQMAQLDTTKRELEGHLNQIDNLWQKRRQPIQDEMKAVDEQKVQLKAKIRAIEQSKNEMPPAPGPSYLHWVDDPRFGTLCNIVIILNLICMFESSKLEHLGPLLPILEQVFLTWYVFELGVKFCYHRCNLFFGNCSRVWWSWLDLSIVASGVLDQWLLPLVIPPDKLSAMSFFAALRIFRVLRVLRLFKVFFSGDMSWTEKPPFETFMAGVIAVNSVTMWLELDYAWPIWPYVENIFLIIYTFELVARMRYLGCRFFTDPKTVVWNSLDTVMVVGGALDLWLVPVITFVRTTISGKSAGDMSSGSFSQVLKLLKMMRILRVLRLVRLLRTIKPLYRLLVGVMEALMAMQWVMVLTLLVLYAGAVSWTTLIGKGLLTGKTEEAEEYFGTVPTSLFSLFKLMNGDTSVVEPITGTIVGQLLFAAFMVLSNWAVLAILTSVVSDNMMTSSARAAEEDLVQQKETERILRAERVRGLFLDKDKEQIGAITVDELLAVMDDRVTGDELKDATALSRRALEDTFEYLEKPNNLSTGRFAGYAGKIIMYEDFINHIDDSSTPADTRSMMHVTAQLKELQKQIATLSK
mmetsp:Transcript_107203/g.313478  ORF Transcript_107203/g.313478 Transcript_107203/m.313478 type:complete len:616 (-) Transcript_107203:170-2017(-)